MTEPLDPLLRALGELERDLERRHPGEWEDALAGRRDPADVAAAREALDPADEHALFVAMFSRPAAEADLDALLDRAAAVLAAPVAGDISSARAAPTSGTGDLSALAAPTSPGATVPVPGDLSSETAASLALATPASSGATVPVASDLSSETAASPAVSHMPLGTAETPAVLATHMSPGTAATPLVAPAASALPADMSPGTAAPSAAPVIPLAGRRRAVALVSVVLAVAAAVLLWRFTAGGPQALLGGYSLTVRNATVQELRGDPPTGDLARYRPDSELDWVVSPEQAAAADVDLRVLARAQDGRTELLAPPFTRSPAGALRIRGRFDTVLPLAPGRWRLTLVIAPAGQAPRDPDAVAAALTDSRAVAAAPPLELELLAPAP